MVYREDRKDPINWKKGGTKGDRSCQNLRCLNLVFSNTEFGVLIGQGCGHGNKCWSCS